MCGFNKVFPLGAANGGRGFTCRSTLLSEDVVVVMIFGREVTVRVVVDGVCACGVGRVNNMDWGTLGGTVGLVLGAGG